MSATGKDTSSTTPSFVAAVVAAAITVGGFSAVWLVLHGRKQLKEVYQPRHELAPQTKRPAVLPDNIAGFWRTVLTLPDEKIIVDQGPDAYFFIRFCKVFGIQMLVPYFLLTFIVCIPLATVAPTAGQTGLNIFTFGNVALDHQSRHVGHFLVAAILMFWTMYLLWREYNHFVRVRQEWLSSAQHLSLARSRTMYISGLPEQYNSESALKELNSSVAGLVGPAAPRPSAATEATAAVGNSHEEGSGIRNIWLTRKVKDLEDVWQDRDDECARLENGVAKLIKLANKNEQKGKTPEKKGQFDAERSNSFLDRYVLPKKQPTWKQGFLGLIGKKMDLQTSPDFIAEHNAQLEEMRHKDYPLANTAFLRFNTQAEALNFAKLAPTTDKKLRMAVKTGIEVIPEDIMWENTGMNPYQRKVRTIISWALTIGLIIVWAIPVAFVGVVSNVDALCEEASWLAWICTLPAPALGIIKGVLPPALLAILFILLPIVLRLWIKLQGEIRQSDVEYKLFTRYWLFQVIHGFIIVTLSSGLINALSNLGNTASSVPTLLATQLPGASIFFLTFILTATFTTAAKAYSRAIPIAMFMLRKLLGGNTPRKRYQKVWKLPGYKWSTTWPPICLLICITVVYSVIQPIITALALLAFCLLYAAHKYTIHWCSDQPDFLETGGMYYIKALRTVFVSLYLEGVCLAGLFFLSTNENGDRAPSGLACGALMIVVIICVAALQIYFDWFAFKRKDLIYGSSRRHPYVPDNHSTPANTKQEDQNAGAEFGNTTGFHERAFDHPALWKKQPVVWMADDPLGVGKYECEQIRAKNVDASTDYAVLDEKMDLQVQRAPPDEAWYQGFTA